MKKNNILIVLFFVVLSVTCFLATAFISAYSFPLKLTLGTAFYFFIIYFLLKKFLHRTLLILLIFLLPLILEIIFINILNFKTAWISLPSNFFLLLGGLSGYFFYKKKTILYLHCLSF